MKQGQIVTAYNKLSILTGQRLPLRVSHQLFRLKQQLQPAMDYQATREQELIKAFPPESIEGNTLKFDNPENGKGFNEGMRELAEMESDIQVTPVKISADTDILISAEEIAALVGFIDIEVQTETEE